MLRVILAAFPLAGQPGVMMSDRPSTPIEEPRTFQGNIPSPMYNGFTRHGKASMECFEETHMCYGSDGSMEPMAQRKSNTRPQSDDGVIHPNKLKQRQDFL